MKNSFSESKPPFSVNYPDDNYISDEDLEDLTKLDCDRSMIMNMAGPIQAKKALARMHKIMGEKEKKHPLKPKFISQEILDKIEELEEEFAKENSDTSGEESLDENPTISSPFKDDSNHVEALFYKKAMSSVSRLNVERSVTFSKIARNFKLFIVVAALFAGYFVYTVYTRNGDILAVENIKNKLPLKLDSNATLDSIDLDKNIFSLGVTLSQSSFFEAQNDNSALDLYIKRTSDKFCKIPIFLDMIKSGKKISVVLKSETGSFSKKFTVENCDK